jgi:UDP-N-acetylglucosamine--N-acetylmuramyl-(pentapeptide) pyrophosphoryl-undecaprenol N-acetylglucosamine transferase
MVLGRPAILIPFAAATDDHQTANAEGYVKAGAGFLVPEANATAALLVGHLKGFMHAPEALGAAANAARGLGLPDAAGRLADLVERQVADLGQRRAA